MKKNLVPIISIILFSIILWGSVSLSDDYSSDLEFPVTISDIPEEYSVAGVSDEVVRVNLQGEGWQLAKLFWGGDHEFSVSARQDSGRMTVETLRALELNSWMSSNLRVRDIDPNRLSFIVEPVMEKKVRVVPDVAMEYKPGYGLVSDITLSPDSVIIEGPVSLINKTDSVRTGHFTFEGLAKNVSHDLKFEESPYISYKREKVNISFDVQKIVDKVFEHIPVETRKIPPLRELLLFPPDMKIVLRGGISKLGKLTEEDIAAYVTFQQALKDTLGVIEPVVEIPEFTMLVDKKPNELEYIIKKF